MYLEKNKNILISKKRKKTEKIKVRPKHQHVVIMILLLSHQINYPLYLVYGQQMILTKLLTGKGQVEWGMLTQSEVPFAMSLCKWRNHFIVWVTGL